MPLNLISRRTRQEASIKQWIGVSDDDIIGSCTLNSKNFRLQDGRIEKRLGSSKLNEDSETTPAKNIGSWKRRLNTKDTLVRQNGSNIQVYIISQSSWVTIPNTITSTDRQYYENYRNEFIVVNGVDELGRLQDVSLTFASAPTIGDTSENLASNWTYETGAYPVDFSGGDYRLCTLTNGATSCTWSGALTADATTSEETVAYDEPTTNLGTEHPAFVTLAKGQLFIWTAEKPNQFRFSDFEELDGTGDKVYDFAVTLTSPPTKAGGIASQSDRLTAISKISDDVWALSTEDGIYSIKYEFGGTFATPIVRPLSGATGVTNPRCLVLAKGIGYYLSTNNKIEAITPANNFLGLSVTNLSDGKMGKNPRPGVKNFLATLKDDQSESFGWYDSKQEVVFWNVIQTGFTSPNAVLGYDTKTGDFYIDSIRQYGCAVRHKDNVYLGDSFSGQIYQDNISTAEKGNQSIPFVYETNRIDFNKPTDRKKWFRTIANGTIGQSTTLEAQIFIEGSSASLPKGTESTDDEQEPIAATGTFITGTIPTAAGTSSSSNLPEWYQVIGINQRGRSFQIKFTNDGTAQEFTIDKNMDIEYRILPRTTIPSTIKR